MLETADEKVLCPQHRRLTHSRLQKRRARHLLLKSCPLPGCFISGKGVRTMSFSDVAVLLTLIGGTIFVTFQITWTIATSDKKRKKK